MDTQLKCKVCGRTFEKRRGLHLHIKKSHGLELRDYYKKYEPKKSKLYKKTIPFKNAKEYLEKDFISREEMIEWCEKENKKIVAPYIKNLIEKRREEKGISYSLSEIELELCNFPNIESYINVFGSYSEMSKQIGLKNYYNKNMPSNFFSQDHDEVKIFIDTREQKPIDLKNSESMKLDFGDYTAAGEFYDYTYIDRKSEQDFKSTLSGENFERFKRELDRAKEFDSYIFIAIESDINKIKINNNFGAHKAKLPYIWHNLKSVSQEYREVCQFVFVKNRNGLKKIIPKILFHGKKLWNVDMQYFINKKIKENE